MLVLSRKVSQSISFPELGIKVTVEKISGSRVSLGIAAPRNVGILRSELIKNRTPESDATAFASGFPPKDPVQRTQGQT